MCCAQLVKRHFGKDKRKEAKWTTTMQNTRLDEEQETIGINKEFERATWRNWCLKKKEEDSFNNNNNKNLLIIMRG